MPNCTVERNLFGSCASSSARLARSSPSSARLLQAHLAGGDDGDLRHGENAVGED
jgi:hypothetical protein